MIEMGLVVALGLLVVLAKLPWRWKMKIISNPVIADLCIFCIMCFLHWGTFSGVMVATVGALACSLVLSAARKLYGHIANNRYYPGVFNIVEKL